MPDSLYNESGLADLPLVAQITKPGYAEKGKIGCPGFDDCAAHNNIRLICPPGCSARSIWNLTGNGSPESDFFIIVFPIKMCYCDQRRKFCKTRSGMDDPIRFPTLPAQRTTPAGAGWSIMRRIR
ncbi:MAG: hypothetical protein EHM81_02110 [Chloroflexi bacterium]|nr:MAG: hypothetical protein EHM81_02110 [Chloroflexota bacterium]